MAKKKKIDKVYSAKSFGLISKKEYFIHDSLMKYLKHLTVPMLMINGYCILDNCKPKELVTHLLPALFATDVFYGLYHVFTDLFDKDGGFVIEDDCLVINTFSGYAVGHHVFTSMYNDVDDDVLASTHLILSIFPVFAALVKKRTNIAKYAAYVSLFFTMIIFSHKYAHMKRHDQKIPFLYEILQNFGLSLDPDKHSVHHSTHYENYSIFNGWCDPLINASLKVFKLDDRIDTLTANIFRYAEEFDTNEIHLRFKGDIEGDIVMYLKDGQLYSEKDYKILTGTNT